MRLIIAAVLVALVGCGDVHYPRTEGEADGGCWTPPECPPDAADLSGGVGNGLCSSQVAGHSCITGHSGGQTCWMSATNLTIYFASSCGECDTLSRCP
jgi:hypothetical protein